MQRVGFVAGGIFDREPGDPGGRGQLHVLRDALRLDRETARRLAAYAEAGADCLYAPRITTAAQISTLVAAVAPKPLNLLINAPFLTVAEAAALGVRRISVGAALAKAAWVAFAKAANEIAEHGTFNGLSPAGPAPNLNATFGG